MEHLSLFLPTRLYQKINLENRPIVLKFIYEYNSRVIMKHVAIIGAGPAGMIASLEASRKGARVTLFDTNPRVGRKLMVTGSGRCNFTNAQVAPTRYYSEDISFLAQVLEIFNHNHLVTYFDQLGILSHATDDGWYYPVSNSAANVVDIFEAHLIQAGVNLQLNSKVIKVNPENEGFRISVPDRTLPNNFDRVIFSAGGPAYPQLGASENCLTMLNKMGHNTLPPLPALAPVRTDPRPLHNLQGVRTDVSLTLYHKDQILIETIGNIIFTKWGINGPGVMDLSHLVSKNKTAAEKGLLRLQIDFLPFHKKELNKMLKSHRTSTLPLRVILESILPPKIPMHFLEQASIPHTQPLAQVSESKLESLFKMLTGFMIDVKGTRGYNFCQASSGGISISEINPVSMKSRIMRGVFFAGEVMDVVGPCGGYNLQWAFSTGYIAGQTAGSG
jgi:predicted Rossmann fold flavoprotein